MHSTVTSLYPKTSDYKIPYYIYEQLYMERCQRINITNVNFVTENIPKNKSFYVIFGAHRDVCIIVADHT